MKKKMNDRHDVLPRHQRPTNLSRFLFGAPYYPEHWTAEDREQDPQRMQDAGVNVVRMAEFAWDVMEPARGQFDFSLFDETIARLGECEIDTILCTPTATPPRWMTAGKPEWMRVTSEGVRMEHGSRQHVCTNNEEFRAESRRITRMMAEHYRDNERVIGWQTDNELYCHFSVCYCDACQVGFRKWLEEKYGTIDALNDAWGARFWAQSYDSFDQIVLPRHGRYPAPGNPSHELDHARYLSDSITEFQRQQVEILREVQPRWWITHNGLFDKIDHWKFAEDLDFYAVDVYPGFGGPDAYAWAALKNELCRYVTGGYIIPEQSGGPGGQLEYMHPTCEPGQMRLWAYQGIAHGADGILHFRWRTCRFGAEIYWNGIIDHDNVLRRRYHEFAQEGRELQKIGSTLLGSVKDVKIGILHSYDNDQMYQTQTNGFPGPWDQVQALYVEGLRRHLPVGLLHPQDSFEGMEVILMPTHIAENRELVEKLEAFVANGGTLLVTARSFTRNADNHVLAATPPAGLTSLLGIRREEEGRIPEDAEPYVMATADGVELDAFGGYEIIDPDTAKTVAVWRVGAPGRHPHPAEGRCGLSMNRFGDGQAYYLGSYVNDRNADIVLDQVQRAAAVASIAEGDPNVEMTIRHKNDKRYLFLLNHSLAEQRVRGVPAGRELMSGQPVADPVKLEPFGVRVVELAGGSA